MNNILYWNVRGLNMVKRQKELFRFLDAQNVSLFSFLETK